MSRFEKYVGLAAALALFVYALACRPSWSPDSSAIVFTYSAEDSAGVAIHDIEADRTENVITFTEGDNDLMLQVLWQKERIVILCHGEEFASSETSGRGLSHQTLVMEYVPETRAFRNIYLHDFGKAEVSPVVPPVDWHDNIILGGVEKAGYGIIAIDEKLKSFRTAGPDNIFILDRGGERIFYVAMDENRTLFEIGLAQGSEFETLADFKSSEKTIATPSLAAAPDGSRCCITVTTNAGQKNIIFVGAGEGEERSRRFTLPGTLLEIGGLAFAADSRTVWMTAIEKSNDSSDLQVLLAEYDSSQGIKRRKVLPLTKIDKDMLYALQPTISPDGRRLALGTFLFEKDGPSRLFLVDLESPDLDMKIVNAPVAAAEGR